MTDGRGIFADTNVLLRLQSAEQEDEAARRTVDRLRSHGFTLCVASQNLAEFWNVCTRPKSRNGSDLSAADVVARLALIENITNLLPEQPSTYPLWRHLVEQHGVRGIQVHDARLVAVMQTYGLKRLLTYLVKDFTRYSGIEVVDPGTVASSDRSTLDFFQ